MAAYTLPGVDHHPDETIFQNALKDKAHPIPVIKYYPLEAHGKSFGIIEVMPVRQGPCVPTKSFRNFMVRDQIYFRRGSSNDVARPDDIKRIMLWIHGEKTSPSMDDEPPSWEEFFSAVHRFDPLYRYILFISPVRPLEARLRAIGEAPWSAVLDFDPDSESDGVLSAVNRNKHPTRNIHLVVKGDRQTINPDKATYWFFPRGLRGRHETLSEGPWRDWKNAYGQELTHQADNIARSIVPHPVVCVVIWSGNDLLQHLRSTLEAFLNPLGPSAELLFVTSEKADLQILASEYEAPLVGIALHQLCSGIHSCSQEQITLFKNALQLPSKSGGILELEAEEAAWLEEDLEVVYLGTGYIRPQERQICHAFLRGAQIEWYELGLHCDVEREITSRIERRLSKDLEAGRIVRLNLFHSPGAGGTTVSRRVAWDFHRNFPTVILKRCVPEDTAERLFRLSSLTGLSVLVVCDGSDIAERQIDLLFDYLRSRQIPACLLQILRRFSPHEEKERSFFLKLALEPSEPSRFVDIFSQIDRSKRSELQQLAFAPDPRMCSPFYFGLQVFGRDFLTLPPYVRARLEGLTPAAQRVVLCLAFAHHYAQHAIPAQVFASLLTIPPSRPVRLREFLKEGSLELLSESAEGVWRTVHDLISVEILEQFLTPPDSDRRLWRQGLTKISVDFINLCEQSSSVPSDELLEVLRRVFIYRDNMYFIGSERAASRKLSHLLEDIPLREGRLTVLQELVKAFPEEAHFWGHLGRFLSIEMRDFKSAIVCIDRAIELQGEDHLLHHMKGMIFRKQAEELMEHRQDLDQVLASTQNAVSCFEAARALEPDGEHGYISEAQLLIKIMDFAGRRQSNIGVVKYLALPTTQPFLRDALPRTEELLERVRRNREGEKESAYEAECRGGLDALYGQHDRALETWGNLLDRGDIYKPSVRRQIVRTYLARRGRTWGNLKPKEIRRSIDLLEENLQEEPYNERDLHLWIQAIRHDTRITTIEAAIEKVAYWKANSGTLDSTYYLYVLHCLLAIDGSRLHREESEYCMNECRQMARRRRNRTKSFEWLGKLAGLAGLIHHSELGEWPDTADFWQHADKLRKVAGRVSRIDGPQAGLAEIEGGLEAFFVPGRGAFLKGRDENEAVLCSLGFSYDGLRAWTVERVN